MVRKWLITTAEETTWPKEGAVVFLGEWCKLYSRKDYWGKFNSSKVEYHWDDRLKLKDDVAYLEDIYEKLLLEVSNNLNKFHEVNYTTRYWRILIGPWLNYFIQILYDRWYMLKSAIQHHNIDYCIILKRDLCESIPADMSHFNRLISSDTWNEVIYAQLLTECFKSELELIEKKPDISFSKINPDIVIEKKSYFKKIILKIIFKLNSWTVKDDEYFFLSTYLPLIQDLRLQFKIGQFPKLWRSPSYRRLKTDLIERKKIIDVNDKLDEFNNIVRKLLPFHIPSSYFEGYKDLLSLSEQNEWPRSPKGIFTSVSYSLDDVFKIWTANKVEVGVPLFIGQHGGHFGTSPFSFQESHPIKISDKFLSWGWSQPEVSKIIPIGNIKEFDSRPNYNKQGIALLVEINMSQYSGYLYSVPVSSQILYYFDDQFKFFSALPESLREKVLVRFPGADKGWNSKLRWEDKFTNVKIDSRKKSLKALVKESRLIISTSNTTTYLESLLWNVPTIIFWDVKYWEIKESVKPYFDLLESVGIFHKTPDSAANKVTEVWDDVSIWWESENVQNARKEFCIKFSAEPENFLSKLSKVICE